MADAAARLAPYPRMVTGFQPGQLLRRRRIWNKVLQPAATSVHPLRRRSRRTRLLEKTNHISGSSVPMNQNFKAAGLIMLAMTMISSNDAVVKTASESLSIGQILFVRGAFACVILGAVIRLSGRPLVPAKSLSRVNLLRAALETVATLCFVTGLSMLPIATASTLVWTAPLLLTLLAAVVLKEHVVPARWIAVILGFVGVLLVTRPFGEGFAVAMVLPLLAAFFVAARDIVTRRIDPELHSFYITLATLVMVTLAGLVMAGFDWRPLQAQHLLMLGGSALLLTGGFFSQVSAIRMGELSFISPFAFVGIIVALTLGYLVWGDVPTPFMLAGIGLIVASCVYIARSKTV